MKQDAPMQGTYLYFLCVIPNLYLTRLTSCVETDAPTYPDILHHLGNRLPLH